MQPRRRAATPGGELRLDASGAAIKACAEAVDATPALTTLTVWCFSVVLLTLGLIPLALIVRNLRLARSAAVTRQGTKRVKAGLVVVEGVVDHPGGAPLRVEIAQSGIPTQFETGSGTQWTESSRSSHTEAFRLVQGDGSVVEVLPDERTELLVDMDRTEERGPGARTRIAEVRDGDHVHVSGRIELRSEVDPSGGYRGAMRQRAILRPAGSAGMLVSKDPLARVIRRPIRQYLLAVVVLLIGQGVIHGLFFGYHVRSRWGIADTAEVVEKVITEDSEGNKSYGLNLRLPFGDVEFVRPSMACFDRVQKGDCVSVLVAHSPRSWQIGTRPSASLVSVIVGFIVLVGTLVSYLLLLRASRRWYAGRLLDETTMDRVEGGGS